MQDDDDSTATEPVVFAIEFESFEKEITNGFYERFQLFVLEC